MLLILKICRIFLIVGFLGIFLQGSVWASDFKEYEDLNIGVSISYPLDWELDENPLNSEGFTVYSPLEDYSDTYRENVGVSYEHVPDFLSFDDYVELVIQNVVAGTQSMGIETTFSDEELVTIDGNPTKKFKVQTISQDLVLESLYYFVEKNEGVYFIIADVKEGISSSYLSTVEKIIDSIIIDRLPDTFLYDSLVHHFSIHYPTTWYKTDESLPFSFLSFSPPLESLSDVYEERLTITVLEDPTRPELEELASSLAENLSPSIPDFNLIEINDLTISDIPAKKIVYTGTGQGDIELKMITYVTSFEQKIYVISFSSELSKFSTSLLEAEKILDSFEIHKENFPTEIVGKYNHEDAGFAITFPQDWDGTKMKKDNISIAFSTSGISTKLFSAEIDPNFSMIMTMIGSYEDMSSINSRPECSVPPTGTILPWGQSKTIEVVGTCTEPTTGVELQMLAYTFATDEDVIYVFYTAGSEDVYNRDLTDFEESLKTLNLSKPVDVSDPTNYAKIFGYDLSMEKIAIGSEDHDIAIVGNVTVTDFSFREDSNQISFGVTQNKGTGVSDIFVGRALKAPYAVEIDGVTIDDVHLIDDKTNGNTIISFDQKLYS